MPLTRTELLCRPSRSGVEGMEAVLGQTLLAYGLRFLILRARVDAALSVPQVTIDL